MKYLAHLNFSKEKESIDAFNQIESFLFNTQPRLNTEFIRKFVRDNAEMKGLFEVIFQREDQDPHFICCYSLKLLVRLLDKSELKQSDFFLKLFVSLPASKLINGYKLSSHLEAKGLPKCKTYAYELLRIYRVNNPTNQFHLTTIFSFKKEMENYAAWEKRQIINSISSEGYCQTRGAALASSPKREEEQQTLIVNDPVYRSRSMTVFQLSPSMRVQNKDNLLWQLSQEALAEFRAHISEKEAKIGEEKSPPINTMSNEQEDNDLALEVSDDTTSCIIPSEGKAYIKVVFPEDSGFRLKVFRFKDMARTALELNKRTPGQRNKKEFFLKFEVFEGTEVSLEVHYLELCNMKRKIIYQISSFYDFSKNIVTSTPDRNDDNSVELCFMGRVEVDLEEHRRVTSASVILQARDSQSAAILCNSENLKRALFSTMQLLSIPTDPEDAQR